MTSVIDRRLNGKGKATVNKDRFIKRYKSKIKDAIGKAINSRSITDMEKGENITIPKKDISEPYFGHDGSGVWETVRPGNKEYQVGDQFRRPRKGQGKGSSEASDDDETSEDDFQFTLTKEEFMQYFFEDLELPDMIKMQLADTKAFKNHRAGYKTSGAASTLSVLRSMRCALGRRTALGGKEKRELTELLEEYAIGDVPEEIQKRIDYLEKRLHKIAFLDPMDLRYRNTVQVPLPSTKAVMFCIMDVSGSMSEERKDMAKRFFILLYLFLTRNYEKIELVFIRHHTRASEVTEHEFFHDQESGGTVVSSALELTHEILTQRYPTNEWNAYIAQASDGDNFVADTHKCVHIIEEKLLPLIQYFAYVQVEAEEQQNLWDAYEKISDQYAKFNMQYIETISDIYPVFVELFKKKNQSAL